MSKAFKVEPSPFEEQRLSLIKQLFPENFLQLESIDSDSKSETLWMDELLNYVCTHLYPTFYFREDTPDGMSNHLPMVLSALFQIKSTLKSTHPPQINEEVYIKNVRSHLEKLIPINPNDQYENETLSQWEEEVYSPFIVKLKKEFSKSNLDSFIKNELSQIFNQIFTGHIHSNRPDFLIYRRYMQIFIYLHVIQYDQSKAFVGEGEILPMHLSETVFENVINHPVILKLMEGISGGAFHPIILLGYGILQHFHTVMVVTALAYQMYSYQNIEPQSELVRSEKEEKCATLLEILGRTDKLHPEYLSDGFRNDLLKKGGFLIHNMMGNAKVSIDQQEYAFQCSQIYDENGDLRFSLEDFCKLALELYLRSDKMDIGTLHTVTASFAFRLVANHVREEKTKKALFGYLWQSFILVYIVIGGGNSLTLKYDSNEIPQWEEIMAHLENDVEEHDIKLVYTCGVEAKTYPKLESLYRQSAAKRLKLIQTESSKP